MARTVFNSTKLAANSDILAPAGTAIDVANGMQLNLNKQSKTILVVTNTAAATKQVTVRKAPLPFDYQTTTPPFPVDYVGQALPVTTGLGFMGPFTGRYAQGDGTIFIDFASGHTGVIYALELPTSWSNP